VPLPRAPGVGAAVGVGTLLVVELESLEDVVPESVVVVFSTVVDAVDWPAYDAAAA
jgi:hypothetical protein